MLRYPISATKFRSRERLDWELAGSVIPVEATIDSVGRVVLPKALRAALGLTPGTTVDISAYGGGVQIVPGGRTARLETEPSGRLVARGETVVTDEMMFGLIDSGRR